MGKKDSFKQGFSKLQVIILVLLLILGGLGAWYWRSQESKKSSQKSQNQTITPKTPSPSQSKSSSPDTTPQVSDETADWQIYSNENYNFSFKYPSGYLVESEDTQSVKGLQILTLKISNQSLSESPLLTLYVDNPGMTAYPSNVRYKIQKVGSGITLTDRQADGNGGDSILIVAGPGDLDGNTYWFQFSYKAGGNDLESEFKNIISTFRLTI